MKKSGSEFWQAICSGTYCASKCRMREGEGCKYAEEYKGEKVRE